MCVPVLIAVALAVMPPAAQDTTPIRAGLVIDRNTTLRRGVYRIQSASIGASVITIRGSNIDLDLSGVELIGSPERARPDQYEGLAILIDGGEHGRAPTAAPRPREWAGKSRSFRLRSLPNASTPATFGAGHGDSLG